MGQSILIIGGGASGSLVALHLSSALKKKNRQATISIVEPSAELARGVAYSTRHLGHLLNVPVRDMSAFESEPDHFFKYLQDKHPDLHPGSFVPRVWFGEYLASLFDVRHVRKTAVGISKGTQQWEVKLDDSTSILADTVVLATGNLKPPAPKEFPGNVVDSKAWIGNAWDDDRYLEIKSNELVGILGTGLTMVDVVKTLRENGHRGKIIATSRRGLLPLVHQSKKTIQNLPPFQNDKKLTAILSDLRWQAALHEKEGGVWQDLMQALRPKTSELWKRLPDSEQKRFLRHLKPYWEIHRHRQPQESMDFLSDLIRQGSLEIKSGRIQSAKLNGNALELSFSDQTLSFDHIINATGAIADFRNSTDPIITNLQQGGWLSPHPLGLGLSVNENLQIIGKNGPAPGLYTLGNPTKGLLWESTAIPDIRKQAGKIADAIISA